MKIYSLLTISIVILLNTQIFAQTTVIVKKTKKAIYVGADSRINIYKQNLLTKDVYRDTGSMCKIWTNNKYSFALVGLYIEKSKEVAIAACNKDSNVLAVIEDYVKIFGNYILKDLEAMRQLDIVTYQKLLNDHKPNLCQIFFVGKQADSLYSYIVRFQVTNTPMEKVNISYIIAQRDLLYGGYVDEIRDTCENPKTWKKEKKIPTIIENLISIESKAHSEWVGGATDILKITKKEIKWIKRKQLCE